MGEELPGLQNLEWAKMDKKTLYWFSRKTVYFIPKLTTACG
jgi:hypothetical protein